MRFDLVINLFVAQALTDGKITVFGGKQERPFLHVSDAADSLIFGIEKNITGTYNVISENMTILQAAERIKKIIGCEREISAENEDNRSYRVSAEKIKQVGFTPLKNLDDTIKEIKDAFSNKSLKDYNDVKYNNYKTLYSSKEVQKEVFIEGISGSLNLP